jgi:hypothetical protein
MKIMGSIGAEVLTIPMRVNISASQSFAYNWSKVPDPKNTTEAQLKDATTKKWELSVTAYTERTVSISGILKVRMLAAALEQVLDLPQPSQAQV